MWLLGSFRKLRIFISFWRAYRTARALLRAASGASRGEDNRGGIGISEKKKNQHHEMKRRASRTIYDNMVSYL